LTVFSKIDKQIDTRHVRRIFAGGGVSATVMEQETVDYFNHFL
jgi:hypothetical protein